MPDNKPKEISERESAQLRCMLRGSAELAESFERYSRETADPQLRDELQKLAAASRNHQNQISSLIGGS